MVDTVMIEASRWYGRAEGVKTEEEWVVHRVEI
jgi:hypothetical protein